MNEQEHKAAVEAWMAEAGEEPTQFGKAVIHVCRRRGIETPEHLEMAFHHEDALRDHCDGVEDAPEPDDLVIAVADAVGLDWRTPAEEDREDLMVLALAWSYNELAFDKPLPGRS